jgi:beta-glucosidase
MLTCVAAAAAVAAGDVACDMYHKYPEDFAMMQQMGIKHYRYCTTQHSVSPAADLYAA